MYKLGKLTRKLGKLGSLLSKTISLALFDYMLFIKLVINYKLLFDVIYKCF